jgi:glucose-6-phosphate 1-dehydrogenase
MNASETNSEEPTVAVPPPGPCAMVIFGATGDLTKRLLMPAVYNLAAADLLPEKFAVVGVAIKQMTAEQFAEKLKADVKETSGRVIDDAV